jgi:hypothetical protein
VKRLRGYAVSAWYLLLLAMLALFALSVVGLVVWALALTWQPLLLGLGSIAVIVVGSLAWQRAST